MAVVQYLNDLLDVSVPDPVDGDILYWDAAAGLWKAKQPPVGGGTVERLVRVSADDIGVRWYDPNWTFDLTWDSLTVGYWSATNFKRGGGNRFLNIYIPKDATIIHAYFKPTARDSSNIANVNTRLHGEKNAAPATFSNYADYDARTRTDAVIDWDNIAAWTAGILYQSPDIKSIIEEIVALDGWASGNPIVIFWDDHDDRSAHVNDTIRRARTWDHASRTPPMLYIEWVA